MAAVEPSNDGQIDSAVLLRKLNLLESSLENKADQHDIKELRDLIQANSNSILKLENRVSILEKAL